MSLDRELVDNSTAEPTTMKTKLTFWLVCWLALGTVGWGQAAQFPPQESEPLPELAVFLEKVKQTLTGDRLLQSQYTFNRRETTQLIDRQGEMKKSWSKTWEVFPSLDPGLSYQRLIEKNDEPIQPSQIEKQDRKHRKKTAKRRKLTPQRIEKKRARAKQEEQRAIEEIFRLYRFRMRDREMVEGISTIVVSFEPRPGYRPRLKSIRPLRKMKGRAWICEDDYQLVKIEVNLIKSVSMGWGLVARLHKGAQMRFLRRKINDEIWLPAESYFLGSGRVLLVKKFRVESRTTYSDYQKFTVESSVEYIADSASAPSN